MSGASGRATPRRSARRHERADGWRTLDSAGDSPGEEATIDIYGPERFEIVPSHWQASTGIVPFMASVDSACRRSLWTTTRRDQPRLIARVHHDE
jgi:hypothetical protein